MITHKGNGMRTVWKYDLQINDVQTVYAPFGATPLTAQMQKSKLALWMLIPDVDAPDQPIEIFIFGTGHPMPTIISALHYLATVQMEGGDLIWHVFVNIPRSAVQEIKT